MVKSCLGERLKKVYLVHILRNKEPSLVAGLSQTAFCRNRNLEESGGIWRNLEESRGIQSKNRNSCPQEFLRKNPVTASKNRHFCDPLQNHVPVKNSSQKHRKKKSSGIMFYSVFENQNIFLSNRNFQPRPLRRYPEFWATSKSLAVDSNTLKSDLINYPHLSDYGQTMFCLSFPSRDRATAPGQYE
jgi:hypothetical protein